MKWKTTLTNKELRKLIEYYSKYPEEKDYVLESDTDSGIGTNLEVYILGNEDTREDLTDYSVW